MFTAIVGFREWIFSEKSGALGRFAAATEYAFGTITQRTLTHPARIRLHYGHPDLFNKMFTMTRVSHRRTSGDGGRQRWGCLLPCGLFFLLRLLMMTVGTMLPVACLPKPRDAGHIVLLPG